MNTLPASAIFLHLLHVSIASFGEPCQHLSVPTPLIFDGLIALRFRLFEPLAIRLSSRFRFTCRLAFLRPALAIDHGTQEYRYAGGCDGVRPFEPFLESAHFANAPPPYSGTLIDVNTAANPVSDSGLK